VPVDGSAAALVPSSALRVPDALVDWTPPPAPTSLLVETVDATGVTVSWLVVPPGSEGSAVVFYTVYRLYDDGTASGGGSGSNRTLLGTVAPDASAPNPRVLRFTAPHAALGGRGLASVGGRAARALAVTATDAVGNEGPPAVVTSSSSSSSYSPPLANTTADYDSVDAAVASGDARLVNDELAVLDYALTALAAANATQAALVDILYPPGSPGTVFWMQSSSAMSNLAPAPSAAHRVFPWVVANLYNWGWQSLPLPAAASPTTQGVAGTSAAGTRFAAIGDNPFNAAGFNATLRRTVGWLLSGTNGSYLPPGGALTVGVGYGDFNGATNWLRSNGFVSNTGSQVVNCAGARPDLCLDANGDNATDAAYVTVGRSVLLVVGGSFGSQDGNNAGFVGRMATLLARADREHIPVLFVAQTAWGSTAAERAVGAALGFTNTGYNYWIGAVTNWTAASYGALRTALTSSEAIAPLTRVMRHLRARDWDVDMTACATTSCSAAGADVVAYLATEFYAGARTYLKAQLDSIHYNGVELFVAANNSGTSTPPPPSSDYRLIKAAVLVGDVLRRRVAFPLSKARGPAQQDWFASYYADHSLYSLRGVNPAQPDVGSFSEQPLPDGVPVFNNDSLTFDTRLADYFTAAGVYALPGVPFTVARADNGTGELRVFVNTQRSGSTQEMESYTRPKYLQSASVVLPPRGAAPLRLTHAYGGPIQLWIQSTSPVGAVRVNFSGVAHHPVWRGPADTPAFTAGLDSPLFSWAELVTPGFQVHSRMALMQDTLSSPFWPTPEAVAKYTYSAFYQVNYNLAGFTGAGLAISPQMAALCAARGWNASTGLPCVDMNIHGLKGMQHFNADQATCGYGCSGNPYDAWWSFSLTGWGDSHESEWGRRWRWENGGGKPSAGGPRRPPRRLALSAH
jgi:hypothetical protein